MGNHISSNFFSKVSDLFFLSKVHISVEVSGFLHPLVIISLNHQKVRRDKNDAEDSGQELIYKINIIKNLIF